MFDRPNGGESSIHARVRQKSCRSLGMGAQNRLLIVDDDKVHRAIYSSIANKLKYQVDVAQSASEAFASLRAKRYRIVILDLMLGEDSGSDVLVLMSSLPQKPRVLLVTGASDEVIQGTFTLGRQMGLEMFGPVRKPVNVTVIRSVLRGMEIGAPLTASA
jgi:DNA-binding response OmpR family regulator